MPPLFHTQHPLHHVPYYTHYTLKPILCHICILVSNTQLHIDYILYFSNSTLLTISPTKHPLLLPYLALLHSNIAMFTPTCPISIQFPISHPLLLPYLALLHSNIAMFTPSAPLNTVPYLSPPTPTIPRLTTFQHRYVYPICPSQYSSIFLTPYSYHTPPHYIPTSLCLPHLPSQYSSLFLTPYSYHTPPHYITTSVCLPHLPLSIQFLISHPLLLPYPASLHSNIAMFTPPAPINTVPYFSPPTPSLLLYTLDDKRMSSHLMFYTLMYASEILHRRWYLLEFVIGHYSEIEQR